VQGPTIAPKVALIFYDCRRAQVCPTGIEKTLDKKNEGVLGFLLGEFFLARRISAQADFCL
jgi:hypothetical protein